MSSCTLWYMPGGRIKLQHHADEELAEATRCQVWRLRNIVDILSCLCRNAPESLLKTFQAKRKHGTRVLCTRQQSLASHVFSPATSGHSKVSQQDNSKPTQRETDGSTR